MAMNLGFMAYTEGRLEQALELEESAKERFLKLNHRLFLGAVLSNIGQAYCEIGDYSRAKQISEEAIGQCRAVGDLGGQTDALISLAQVHAELGELSTAIEIFNRAVSLSEEHSIVYTAMMGMIQRSIALLDAGGDSKVAIADAERVIDIAGDTGMQFGLALGHTVHARALACQGRLTEAVDHSLRAVAEVRDASVTLWSEVVWHTHAEILATLGETREALRCANEAVRIVERIASALSQPEHARSYARRRIVRSIRALQQKLSRGCLMDRDFVQRSK